MWDSLSVLWMVFILMWYIYVWNVSYIELRMWNQVGYDPSSYGRNLCNNLHIEARNIQDFNGVWTCVLAIPVQRSNQTELWGHWSWKLVICGFQWTLGEWMWSYIYEIFYILNCGCEIKLAMIFAVMNAIYSFCSSESQALKLSAFQSLCSGNLIFINSFYETSLSCSSTPFPHHQNFFRK